MMKRNLKWGFKKFCRIEVSEEVVDQIMMKTDLDENGTIEFNELEYLMRSYQGQRMEKYNWKQYLKRWWFRSRNVSTGTLGFTFIWLLWKHWILGEWGHEIDLLVHTDFCFWTSNVGCKLFDLFLTFIYFSLCFRWFLSFWTKHCENNFDNEFMQLHLCWRGEPFKLHIVVLVQFFFDEKLLFFKLFSRENDWLNNNVM